MEYDCVVGAYCNTHLQGRFGIIMPDIFKILGSHRSIRKYKSEPIPDDLLISVLTSARLAPTSSNVVVGVPPAAATMVGRRGRPPTT